jgi:alkanesulfonate monooxygenase SsuD/methylene tetrahydromethanopterin reductase-like flavin-dependent oxidoreductase (luciferase family)
VEIGAYTFDAERVTWSGRLRAPLHDQPVHPRPVQNPLPVWVAVGGNPRSVVRAGALGLPLALAIIGGEPERFAPLAQLYREALARSGHEPQPFSLNVHGFVAESSQVAGDIYYPAHSGVMNRIGRERGWGRRTAAHSTPRSRYAAPTWWAHRLRWPRRSSSSTSSSDTTAR